MNLRPGLVNLEDLRYETVNREFLAVVDGNGFMLDINEFGVKR